MIFKRTLKNFFCCVGVLVTLTASFGGAGAQMHKGMGNETRGMESRETGAEPPSGPMNMAMGGMVYKMSCVFCHGSGGKGDGPASIFIGPYSHPRPNDFTTGNFKFRSTESGDLPMLEDLMRTIREGIPGFMPSFRNLGEEKIRQVALFISSEFIGENLPRSSEIAYVEHAGPYTYSVESVKRGRKLFSELKCADCHGEDGRGAEVLFKDDRGLPIMPVDLTRPESFGNGIAHEDIYRTIMTGLNGTPMPSYSHLFKGKEQSAWDLVHYILFLQEK